MALHCQNDVKKKKLSNRWGRGVTIIYFIHFFPSGFNCNGLYSQRTRVLLSYIINRSLRYNRIKLI